MPQGQAVKLKLTRNPSTAHCTLGALTVDGEHACFTLEDVVRDAKIAGETAIPAGAYEVIINHSARFGRELPLLLNVPGFVGVRIHSGNTDKDTEGCILVGEKIMGESVVESRKAFIDLFVQMQEAIEGGEKIHLEIT